MIQWSATQKNSQKLYHIGYIWVPVTYYLFLSIMKPSFNLSIHGLVKGPSKKIGGQKSLVLVLQAPFHPQNNLEKKKMLTFFKKLPFFTRNTTILLKGLCRNVHAMPSLKTTPQVSILHDFFSFPRTLHR